MDFREDPPDSVIEEIAAILATGYLRLCKARTLASLPCRQPHAIGERVEVPGAALMALQI